MWRCRSSLETDRFMASTLWFDFERISDVHTGSERAVLEIIGTPLVANSHLFLFVRSKSRCYCTRNKVERTERESMH